MSTGYDGKNDSTPYRMLSLAGAQTIDESEFDNHNIVVANFTTNGTQAVALPAAADCPEGAILMCVKTGTAGAITFTPASGTVGGASTHAALDAQGEGYYFIADPDNTNWIAVNFAPPGTLTTLNALTDVTITSAAAGDTIAYSGSAWINYAAAAYADPIPLETGRVHDAVMTGLPTTASSDDLGLIAGSFGTNAPVLQTIDFKTTTATAYARYSYKVPKDYVAGAAITLRVDAGYNTTASDGTMTVDAEVYRRAAPSVDICATAAQSINAATSANKDFTITPTDVVPGDVLDIRVKLAGSDTATGTAVIGQINALSVRPTSRV